VKNIIKELGCLLRYRCDKRFVLNPLRKLVNGNINIFESTRGYLERPNHIQSPACEWLRGWDRLEGLLGKPY
jgi:hypothetical protein